MYLKRPFISWWISFKLRALREWTVWKKREGEKRNFVSLCSPLLFSCATSHDRGKAVWSSVSLYINTCLAWCTFSKSRACTFLGSHMMPSTVLPSRSCTLSALLWSLLTITSCSKWMSNPKSKAVLSCACRSEPAHKTWRRGLAWAEPAGHMPMQRHKAACHWCRQKALPEIQCDSFNWMSHNNQNHSRRHPRCFEMPGDFPLVTCQIWHACAMYVRGKGETGPFWPGHGPVAITYCFSQWRYLTSKMTSLFSCPPLSSQNALINVYIY